MERVVRHFQEALEVVKERLLGMGDHLELWDAKRLAQHEAELMSQPMPDALKAFTF